MRTMGRVVALLALAVGSPGAGHAEQCSATYELVGFSSAMFNGGRGMFTYTRACQEDFGWQARMCESQEVLRTTDLPADLVGSAWLRPSSLPDMSGVPGSAQLLTCTGWVGTGSGLTVDDTGGFSSRDCTTPQAIACCVPTQVPVADAGARHHLAYAALAFLVLSLGAGAMLLTPRARVPFPPSGQRALAARPSLQR